MTRVLVARLDNDGDVLLAGPAVRAVAASAQVVMLVSPRGRQAAALLPGVADTVVWRAPWIDPAPLPVSRDDVEELINRISALSVDAAVLLTSFHQSALPLALLLRLAGVPRITAISEDYPGSLLDVRHRVEGDVPEAERALSVAAAAGYALPAGDDGRLAVRRPLPDVAALVGDGPYVVLHPGASVPARSWSPRRCAEAVRALAAAGRRVLVTGGPAEAVLTAEVAAAALGREAPGAVGNGPAGIGAVPDAGPAGPGGVLDLGGRTSLAELAAVLAGAEAVVVGNTGPAHLAAAVGTPVVSLFAPVVPAARWAPYGVRAVLLGDQHAACRATRATVCPVPGHPCLESVTAADVLAAVDELATAGVPA